MPRYNVPMEFSDEDKIIGGILSLRQIAYLVIAACLDLGIFFLSFLPWVVRVALMIPFPLVAVVLAFIEHPDHGRIDKLLFAYLRFMRRPKQYVQGGKQN